SLAVGGEFGGVSIRRCHQLCRHGNLLSSPAVEALNSSTLATYHPGSDGPRCRSPGRLHPAHPPLGGSIPSALLLRPGSPVRNPPPASGSVVHSWPSPSESRSSGSYCAYRCRAAQPLHDLDRDRVQ